jgi:hypothetical protein
MKLMATPGFAGRPAFVMETIELPSGKTATVPFLAGVPDGFDFGFTLVLFT